MKKSILLGITVVLLLGAVWNVAQINKSQDVTVFYEFSNEQGKIYSTTARQIRSDGSWYEFQRYWKDGQAVGHREVLYLAGKGGFSIKDAYAEFEGEHNGGFPDVLNLNFTGKHLGYNTVELSEGIHYSPEVRAILFASSGEMTMKATKVISEIDPKVFAVPTKEIRYGAFLKSLEQMADKEEAQKLKNKYVPAGYKIKDGEICDNH